MKEVTKHGIKTYKINKNKQSVNAIKEDLKKGLFIPNCLTFNINMDNPSNEYYVDEENSALLEDKILTGYEDDSYKTTPEDIEGYTLINTIGNITSYMLLYQIFQQSLQSFFLSHYLFLPLFQEQYNSLYL